MTEYSDQHPALDPDRVEQYVLGRLTPREQQAFDSHLQLCAQCKQAVDAELRLAAGVRRSGRDELKKRLAVSLEERSAVPWPRLMAAAAIVVIVAGIGIVSLWINRQQATDPSLKETPPSAAEQRTGSEGTQDKLAGSVQTSPPGPKGAAADRVPIPSRQDARKPKEQFGAPKDEAVSVADARRESAKNEAQTPAPAAGASIAGSAAGVWTEGTLLETEPSSNATARSNAAEEKLDMVGPAHSKKTMKAATETESVLLYQQPSQSLTQRQRQQQSARRQRILTYAEQLGTQIQLTLYPDTLFAPADLARAAVNRLGEDSLLIRVGQQSIGYRLPQGFLQQRTRK
jgi:hypothetical protein